MSACPGNRTVVSCPVVGHAMFQVRVRPDGRALGQMADATVSGKVSPATMVSSMVSREKQGFKDWFQRNPWLATPKNSKGCGLAVAALGMP